MSKSNKDFTVITIQENYTTLTLNKKKEKGSSDMNDHLIYIIQNRDNPKANISEKMVQTAVKFMDHMNQYNGI